MIIPGSANSLLLGGDDQYQIARSLRFNSADSADLSRTPASASNRKTWTWSGWVKRSTTDSATNATVKNLLLSANTGAYADFFGFNISTNKFEVSLANTYTIATNAVFRDLSAWYHVVVVLDASNATAANRLSIYINNVLQTTTGGTIANQNYGINNTIAHAIGSATSSFNGYYFNGYMTEVNFIDGQALTPSSFGENNAQTGVWQPKAYTGTYGTNGFYLKFADNSGTTSTTLGKDSSGNGNNWTPNNFSVTAGAGNDSLVDTPTSYGTDTGVGGEVRGNYCTINPFQLSVSGALFTLTNGNLDYSCNASSGNAGRMYSRGTMALPSGKTYWEATATSTNLGVGILSDGGYSDSGTANSNLGGVLVYSSATQATQGTTTATYSGTNFTFTTNDVIGFAFDGTAMTLGCYKNGSLIGTWSNFETTKTWFPAFGINSSGSSTSVIANFGQRPFAYTAPSGFRSLCTTNLLEPTIAEGKDYFNAKLWTGNGSTQSITGIGHQPSLVWTKDRSAAFDHTLFDAVRGATKFLRSNDTTAEETRTDSLTSFDSDGFSVGADSVRNNINKSGASYVSWCWKANGAGSSNTSGTITSTVSANTTSGFSIVTYTGTGSNATVGHGLGAVPSMIIVKGRNATADNWVVAFDSAGFTWSSDYYRLNLTNGKSTDGAGIVWRQAPTSSVFSIGTASAINENTKTFVAYCFAPVAGYSAFGSYTGNGSTDGPFVYTNHRPAFLLVKRTDTTASWMVVDSARDTYNMVTKGLYPNLSDAEGTGDDFDFLSNGFKLRDTGAGNNASGGTYIYAAFAESPFKFSLAR